VARAGVDASPNSALTCRAATRVCRFVTEGAGIEREPFRSSSWRSSPSEPRHGSSGCVRRSKEKPRSRDQPGLRSVRRPPARETGRLETVAEVFQQPSDQIRNGRGGVERMVAAWLAATKGWSELGAIATALRLKSTSRVSMLIRECDEQLDPTRCSEQHRPCVESCAEESFPRGDASQIIPNWQSTRRSLRSEDNGHPSGSGCPRLVWSGASPGRAPTLYAFAMKERFCNSQKPRLEGGLSGVN